MLSNNHEERAKGFSQDLPSKFQALPRLRVPHSLLTSGQITQNTAGRVFYICVCFSVCCVQARCCSGMLVSCNKKSGLDWKCILHSGHMRLPWHFSRWASLNADLLVLVLSEPFCSCGMLLASSIQGAAPRSGQRRQPRGFVSYSFRSLRSLIAVS